MTGRRWLVALSCALLVAAAVATLVAVASGRAVPYHDGYRDRLARELSHARAARTTAVAANRRALDPLPVSPGARLRGENQNPESSELQRSFLYELYVHEHLSVEDYLTLDAGGWGTFRTYDLPQGVRRRDVARFYVSDLTRRGVVTLDAESGEPRLELPGRCIWVTTLPPFTGERHSTYWLATSRGRCS